MSRGGDERVVRERVDEVDLKGCSEGVMMRRY